MISSGAAPGHLPHRVAVLRTGRRLRLPAPADGAHHPVRHGGVRPACPVVMKAFIIGEVFFIKMKI